MRTKEILLQKEVAMLKPFKTMIVIFLILIIFTSLLAGCTEEKPSRDQTWAEINGSFIGARTGERYFEIYDGDNWKNLTVKGVNIGTSLPGRWYTEFPADRELYRSWLEDIAAMNANTIRLYTLLDPAFYTVLAEFNSDPANDPLWLIQEIWPHDEVPQLNLYNEEYLDAYREEIRLVIDALHGNADIPARPYRAYGNYGADVSPYILGILVGRELEPEEVDATNQANPELDRYDGEYVQTTAQATPTEVWLAEMCDYVLEQSQKAYEWQYPVGFVSWPTLDPLDHLTEYEADGTPGYNVQETVDPNIFTAGKLNRAGFFGAYHIYPNYPDFMNNEPAFAEYRDEMGTFRYTGYLDKFMAVHPAYPALVAEFGISTSLNTAHFNPDGLHHGAQSEEDQGIMVVRMMRAILDQGYAGGVIFEWSDEWAKKTWNTEPFMVPWERQVLWQNAMCPEQNYGILAVEPLKRPLEDLLELWLEADSGSVYNPVEERSDSYGKIKSLAAGADEAYLYLALELGKDRTDEPEIASESTLLDENFGLLIGIDTGSREAGEFLLPVEDLPVLTTGAEFLLHLENPDQGKLLVVSSYNRGLLNFYPQPSHGEGFSQIKTLVNRERETADGRFFSALYANESNLIYGNFNPDADNYNSLAHWYADVENDILLVRLPWMLLNVSDPSEKMIIQDPGPYIDLPLRDELEIVQTEGFIFYAATYRITGDETDMRENPVLIDFEPRTVETFTENPTPYLWDGWEEPRYQFRFKESYPIIADYFGSID